MPRLRCADRQWQTAPGANLLDSLLEQGIAVPYSCRAGACHSCLVRCVDGEPEDLRPEALDAQRRAQGWRLACQCQVTADLQVEVYDPLKEGLPARIEQLAWLSETVLQVRLRSERPLRYRAGEHLVLWTEEGIARPYSLASLPGEDELLEFHLGCHRPGAFCDAARRWQVGQTLRLGERHAGALHYDSAWAEQPLLLLAAGTGLAPLWGVLREALRQQHAGPIRLVHVAGSAGHYLVEPLQALARQYPQLSLAFCSDADAAIGRPSRQSIALVCGGAAFVERCGRQLFMAGLPRRQVLADVFLARD